MNGRKLAAFALSGVMAVGLTACGGNGEPNESPAGGSGGEAYLVGICQLAPHDALDAATRGFKAALVEAFGEEEPVATVPGQTTHVLELTRLYATDEAIRDGIDFYGLSDFSLVICKPDRKIIYSGCQWSSIGETGALGAMVVEKITIVAARRIETAV